MIRPPVLALSLALAVVPRSAGADGRPACLGAGVGQLLEQLARDPAFEGAVPSGFRLARLDVDRDHIELGYDGPAGPAAVVTLSLAGDGPSRVGDGRGPGFEHHVRDLRGDLPEAARLAMLGAAMTVDRAIPRSELQRCGGGRPGPPALRAPRAFGLGMGLLQVAIIVAALFFGVMPPKRTSTGT